MTHDPDSIPLSSPAALAYDAAAAQLATAAPPPTRALRYGPDRAQHAAVWSPQAPGPHPILIFWHGGAWVSGHPGWVAMQAAAVLALPAILVAPAYRLAPRCRWPAQLEDALALLAYVRSHAADWDGDPARIALAGHSAGGHLAAHAALRSPQPRLACLPVSAPLDLRYGDVPLESDAGRVYRYLLAARDDDADASPIVFAPRARCPFHLSWGGADLDRVADSNPRFAVALASPFTTRIVPAAAHFDTHLALADPADPWYAALTHAFAAAQ